MRPDVSSGMVVPRRERVSRIVLAVLLGLFALVRIPALLAYEPVPWAWVAAVAVGTALLAGPVAWAARQHLSAERRGVLALVAVGVAMLSVPIVVGFGLVFGNLLLVLDAGVVGGVVGLAAAVLAERTVVPERLRGTGQ